MGRCRMLDFLPARRLLSWTAVAGLGAALAAGCDDEHSVADDGATCSELGGQARAEGFDVLAAADHSCSQDSECVVSYQHPRCTDSCGYQEAINISAVIDVQTEMLYIESEYCYDFERQSCNILIVPCVSPGTPQPVCRDGECELEPE
jgi:hypothetical protein